MLPLHPYDVMKWQAPDQTVRIFVAQNMATIKRNIGFTTESVKKTSSGPGDLLLKNADGLNHQEFSGAP